MNQEPVERTSFARALGALVGIFAGELAALAAIVGGLWTGFACLLRAEKSVEAQWHLYLIAGGIFTFITFACRWRGR
jgi:hypothetical protein